MLKKSLALALALLACLSLPGVAAAKTKTLTGKLEGDSSSKVTIKVVVNKKGVPKRVKSFSFKASYRCVGGADAGNTGVHSQNLGGGELRKVGKKYYFNVSKTIGTGYYSLAPGVEFNRKATKASGDLMFGFNSNGSGCRGTSLTSSFSAKAKAPKKKSKKRKG